MNRLFYFILFLFVVFSCSRKETKNSFSDESKTIKSGYEIFHERCTSCHGADGKLNFGGAKDLTASIKSIEEIKIQVLNGKGAMPPFKNILSASEIDSVCHFASSFSK